MDKLEWYEYIRKNGYSEVGYDYRIHFNPEVIIAIEEFLKEHDYARYGPSHCVLDDFNLEDYWIEKCIEELVSGELLDFLREIQKVPEEKRLWRTTL